MKYVLGLAFLLVSMSVSAHAQGNGTNGGGSNCEIAIKRIQNKLIRWVNFGKLGQIDLSSRKLTMTEYRERMRFALNVLPVEVSCPKPEDYLAVKKKNHLRDIEVNGVSKTCINYYDDAAKTYRIVCDYQKFVRDTDPVTQFQLVHHEFASLKHPNVMVELNHGSKSDYSISDQLRYAVKKSVTYDLIAGEQIYLKLQVADKKDLFLKAATQYVSRAWSTKTSQQVLNLLESKGKRHANQMVQIREVLTRSGDISIIKFIKGKPKNPFWASGSIVEIRVLDPVTNQYLFTLVVDEGGVISPSGTHGIPNDNVPPYVESVKF